MKKERLLIIFLFFLLFLLGVFYRISLASLFPHKAIFDEADYVKFARKINANFFYADCCTRTYGYPFFLSVVFKIFGDGNLKAVVFLQAILDTLTAFLIYLISSKIYRDKNISLFSFVIYLFNPLTASYTGLYLSEIWAIFLLTLVFWFLINTQRRLVAFFFGLVLGLFTFSRIMFFWWSLGVIGVLFFLHFKKKFLFGLLICFGFSISLIYPVWSNFVNFSTFSPLPIIPTYYLDFYDSIYFKKINTLLFEKPSQIELKLIKEHWQIRGKAKTDKKLFLELVRPKLEKAISYVKTHPFEYTVSRLRNMIYLWDKNNLYYYTDPFYPTDKLFVKSGNALFLTFCTIGIIALWRKKQKTKDEKFLLIFTLSLIFYLTVPFSLLTPEERHTLPAYPLLSISLPLGIKRILGKVKLIKVL